MIKGSLKDISLPGLLQFLSNEGQKSYRIKIERGSAHGDLMILEGHLISANYGLLIAEDALCEFMTWDDGAFYVERLSLRFQSTIERNMNLRLLGVSGFSEHAAFLLEHNVGLNTVVRPSRLFGTPEWQESSKLQPLQREDFLILGWLSGGRTMRQSMREFSFDLVQCTAILYRLILTRSVEIVRASGSQEIPGSPGEIYQTDNAGLPVLEEHAILPAVLSAVPSNAGQPGAPAQPAALAQPEPHDHDESRPMQRTTVLPIISIDMERLMKATFSISEFGLLALKNPSLDEGIKQLLKKVEDGLSIEEAIEQESRMPYSVLSTYRYCMDRGYISNADPVLQHTADLLLGRMEMDQYLLQRRRVSGEELRDLSDAARADGVKLIQMLVTKGFLSQEDLDNVNREQLRFAMR